MGRCDLLEKVECRVGKKAKGVPHSKDKTEVRKVLIQDCQTRGARDSKNPFARWGRKHGVLSCKYGVALIEVGDRRG